MKVAFCGMHYNLFARHWTLDEIYSSIFSMIGGSLLEQGKPAKASVVTNEAMTLPTVNLLTFVPDVSAALFLMAMVVALLRKIRDWWMKRHERLDFIEADDEQDDVSVTSDHDAHTSHIDYHTMACEKSYRHW
jgi:hypothetical protein